MERRGFDYQAELNKKRVTRIIPITNAYERYSLKKANNKATTRED